MFECVRKSGKTIKNIKVGALFQNSPPNPEKLIRKTAEFINEGRLSAIYVDKDFNLLDGYCSYLIATTLDYKRAKIVQFRKREKPEDLPGSKKLQKMLKQLEGDAEE